MFEDDDTPEDLEETLRSIARELGRSVERAIDTAQLEELADRIGVDPTTARGWAESAGSWLRSQTEGLGDVVASKRGQSSRGAARDEMLPSAAPHPLDLPTEDQGRALAALDSGRWAVEPGAEALVERGEGSEPRDSLGIVRELQVRDWVAADGEITLAGRHALTRWLDAGSR